jgi:energy-coupling factor transporter ATP-binding protein EcfA2
VLAEFPVLRQQARLKSSIAVRVFRVTTVKGEVMTTAMQSALIQELDTKKRSSTSRHFEDALRQKIVGQDEAVQALVELYQVFCAGLQPPGRPVGNLLFLGPTGSGKTRIVEAAAEILFGDSRALIKVDCAEFQHSHEIAKLIGSPPGYLGHRETHPLITQEELAKSHRGEMKLSFLLFDEIEKASDALWQLLLGMLDKATLTLGDNRRVVDLTDVIFIDSVGEEVLSFFGRSGAEFAAPTSYTLDVTPFAEKRPTYTTLTLFQKRETLKSPVNTSLLEIRVRVSTAFPPSCNFLRRSLSAVSPGTYGMPGCGQRMSPL